MRHQVVELAVVLALSASAGEVRAASAVAPCSALQGPRLSLRAPAAGDAEAIDWVDIVRHVTNELGVRGVRLCSDDADAAARLELQAVGTILHMRLVAPHEQLLAERSLELSELARDARSLSVAVAADELVSANAAALLPRSPPPAPKQPISAAPSAPKPRPDSSWELGPVFDFEAFAGGQRLLGVDARAGLRLAAPFSFTARLGFRQGLPQAAPHGSVRATALVAGLGLRCQLLQFSRFSLAALGRIDAWRLDASAYAAQGAVSHEANGVALVAMGGAFGSVELSRHLALVVEASAGSALRPVHVTDAGQRVSGIAGAAAGLAGGVIATF